MSMKKTRDILPRTATASSGTNASKDAVTKVPKETKAKRAMMVGRACNACRKTKCKCDGVRPTCGKCVERESSCVYDTEEGMTRTATLNSKNTELTNTNAQLLKVITALYDNNPTEENLRQLRSVGISPPIESNIHGHGHVHGHGHSHGNDWQTAPSSAVRSMSRDRHHSTALGEGHSDYVDDNSSLAFDQTPAPYTDQSPTAPFDADQLSPIGSSMRHLWPNVYSSPGNNMDSFEPIYPGAPSAFTSSNLPQNHAPSRSFETVFAEDPVTSTSSPTKRERLTSNHKRRRSSYADSRRSSLGHSTHDNLANRRPSLREDDREPSYSGGYDPNDGRISGRQDGWHFVLVIKESRFIATSVTSIETRESEYRPPYQRPPWPLQADTFHQPSLQERMNGHELEPGVQLLNSGYPGYATSSENAFAEGREFLPPPGAVAGYGNLPMSSALLANGYPPSTQRRQLLNFRVPEHCIPPLLVEETSPLAGMYVAFRDTAMEMIGSGFSVPLILGDPDSVYVDLFIRDRVPMHTLSNVDDWACQLMRNLPDFDVFVQFAWIGLLSKFMRWILHPTAENYARVPDIMKPIKSQRLIPHSPALDMCPHPGMREALMQHYRDWVTPSLVGSGSTMIVWLEEFGDAVEWCPVTGRPKLTAAFEHFTQDRNSWNLGSAIVATFPEAAEHGIRVREEVQLGQARIDGQKRPDIKTAPEGTSRLKNDELLIRQEIEALQQRGEVMRAERRMKDVGGAGVGM